MKDKNKDQALDSDIAQSNSASKNANEVTNSAKNTDKNALKPRSYERNSASSSDNRKRSGAFESPRKDANSEFYTRHSNSDSSSKSRNNSNRLNSTGSTNRQKQNDRVSPSLLGGNNTNKTKVVNSDNSGIDRNPANKTTSSINLSGTDRSRSNLTSATTYDRPLGRRIKNTKLQSDSYITVGRRKSAKAQVRLSRGTGKILINGRTIDDYFARQCYRKVVTLPLDLVSGSTLFDVKCKVVGGGTTGQCDAIKLGIARALKAYSPEYTGTLKKHKCLTRDSRKTERKLYGHLKSRKKTQYSKR